MTNWSIVSSGRTAVDELRSTVSLRLQMLAAVQVMEWQRRRSCGVMVLNSIWRMHVAFAVEGDEEERKTGVS